MSGLINRLMRELYSSLRRVKLQRACVYRTVYEWIAESKVIQRTGHWFIFSPENVYLSALAYSSANISYMRAAVIIV